MEDISSRMLDFYMNVANQCATMSRAIRLQVGCVVVKNNNIISFSWNGTPRGWDNMCETKEYMFDASFLDADEIESQYPFTNSRGRYALKTKQTVIHAESNALMKLAKAGYSSAGATLLCTHSPCIECAKLIYQSGIEKVYFQSTYRSTQGAEFLTQAGIQVMEYTPNAIV